MPHIKLSPVKGTKDRLHDEAFVLERFFKYVNSFFYSRGFGYIVTPVLERAEVFTQGVGVSSDIVKKEMYHLTTSSGEELVLRPEGTSAVMRAYLNQDSRGERLEKFWYFAPMYRHERPQKGRYREFYQFGVEVIGTDSVYADIELLSILYDFYRGLGLNDIKLVINYLGCRECMPRYKEALKQYYANHYEQICDDCKSRYKENILRVLDCKNKQCEIVKQNAPKIENYLCEHCKKKYDLIRDGLVKLGVPYEEDFTLVRGLDYYNGLVFEVISEKLGGRQNALGGGGRYNYLSRKFIDKDVPSIGFAGGVERTLLVLQNWQEMFVRPVKFCAFPLSSEIIIEAYNILQILYKELDKIIGKDNFVLNFEYKAYKPRKAITRALNNGCNFVVLIGEDEVKNNMLVVKNLQTKEEIKVKISELAKSIEQLLKK